MNDEHLTHIRNHYRQYGNVAPNTAVAHIRELLDYVDALETGHLTTCEPCTDNHNTPPTPEWRWDPTTNAWHNNYTGETKVFTRTVGNDTQALDNETYYNDNATTWDRQ